MQHDLVDRLQDEVARLRERICELEAILTPGIDVPVEFRLTATEARIFAHLTSKALCTKRSIHAAAYGHLFDEAPDESVLESHICKLRRKIKPFGFAITSERFAGYRLVSPGAGHG